MNTERVMERVRRLLAIANDPAASDNEQRIALEQAQRLMDKHAIEEWQLEENHDDVEIIKRRIRLETNPCNRYMAQLANIDAMPATPPLPEDALIDLRKADAATLRPMLDALHRGELHELVLDFADGSQFTLRRVQRWRFWRRPFAIRRE